MSAVPGALFPGMNRYQGGSLVEPSVQRKIYFSSRHWFLELMLSTMRLVLFFCGWIVISQIAQNCWSGSLLFTNNSEMCNAPQHSSKRTNARFLPTLGPRQRVNDIR